MKPVWVGLVWAHSIEAHSASGRSQKTDLPIPTTPDISLTFGYILLSQSQYHSQNQTIPLTITKV